MLRLLLVLQFCLLCVVSIPAPAVAQGIDIEGSILDHPTVKWLDSELKKRIEEIKKGGGFESERRAKKDNLCLDVPKELDKRLTEDRLEPSHEELLRQHYLLKTYGVIDDTCWCLRYKKWCKEGTLKRKNLDEIAEKICPHLFPKKPDGGPKEEPKPTPVPTPKDGTKGGIKEGTRVCPAGLKLIDDCVKTEGISISITGDGAATSHSKLTLKDPKTGNTSSVVLETVCMSRKTKLPPPTDEVAQAKNIHYRLGPAAPAFMAQTLNAVEALDAQGKFAKVPIPAARRKATITQLSIWHQLGGTGEGKDAINRDNVKEDMMKKAGIKKSELTDSEDKRLTDKVDLICEAVDLTCKESETTTTERPKREKEKPGIPITDRPTGGHTDDGGQTGTEKPEKPRHPDDCGKPGGGNDEPTHPEEGIICIPELTTFECDNPEYQTMCTVADAVIECPETPVGGDDYDGTPLAKVRPCVWKLHTVTYEANTGRVMPAEGTSRTALEKTAQGLVGTSPKIPSAKDLVTPVPSVAFPVDVWLTFVCVEPDGTIKHAAVERVPIIDLRGRWNPKGPVWGGANEVQKRLNSVTDTLKGMRGI